MIDFDNRDLFTPCTHPDSGMTFHVLTRRVAPVQQSFYFVNDGMSADGRYLWFYCAFPPAGNAQHGRTLGVVDFQTGTVRHIPETQFGEASPYVAPETGAIYWQHERYLWRLGPEPGAEVEPVGTIPDDLIGHRRVLRAATHLTRSADGRELFVDLGLELQWLFGSLALDTGAFELWHRFDRLYDHAQFSPTDPDHVLFAEENHADPITGLQFPIVNRLWHIRRGGAPRPVFTEPVRASHEWWDADGRHVWCVHGNETWRIRLADGVTDRIAFPRHCWHSHSSRDGRLIVGDSNTGFYRGCASTVQFMNRDSGKVLVLAEHPACEGYVGAHYHIDPHPRFCCDDRYVVFTTTVLGSVDVAIVPVAALRERTA